MSEQAKITVEFSYKTNRHRLAINPGDIEFDMSVNNTRVETIGLGEILILGTAKLETFSISSWFWAEYDTTPVEESIEFFKKMAGSKIPISFLVTGLNINMTIGIDSFKWGVAAGQEADRYFTLQCSQYRPYGAKVISPRVDGVASADGIIEATPPPPPRVDNKPPTPRTYTVLPGDSLWVIAKQFSNSGGTDWSLLYEANKVVVGNNPSLIFPGQVLTIPESWVGA